MPFTHLHTHSTFSPGWGVRTPAELCARARGLGMTHLALTDRNGLYGIPLFLEAAAEHGIRPLIGAEAVTARHRAVLLARDAEGYANLCRLLSELHCREGFELPAGLRRFRGGLVVLSDDAELLGALCRDEREGLYAELSPGHNLHRALACARQLRLPPVATSRATLLEPDDLELHRVLRAIQLNTKLCRLEAEAVARPWDLLLAESELADHFPHCPEALENTAHIAELCQSDWDFSATIFPAFRGLGEAEAFAALERRARAGALRRYGGIDGRVEARLGKELGIIRTKGFAHYFLVVEELAAQSPRTCGRGSAAASLVAYCLGITHVDPIRHNLFFERFLNPGRIDPPDIDIDFPWDERDAVLDFAFARYGSRRAAMVANQIGFKGRAALREVAKVYGMPEGEIKTMTSRISGYWKAEQSARAVEEHPLFEGEALSEDWRSILAVARRLSGHLRHLSLHCGGLVVVPDEIRRYVPVEVAAKGLPVIQWEKDQAESAGLVKIDILGNRSLAVIRDALAAIQANTGREIDYASWDPLADEATKALLRSGRTMGCFYIESPATRQLLQKMWGDPPDPRTLHCDVFEHLVMASSIIRPAANNFIREFVARMRGKPWQALHPRLDAVLAETYGIAVYQEQITQMAMALAGFSAFDGDQLRKIISKKHKGKKLEDYRRMFFAGAAENGIGEEIVAKAWAQILSFGGYSFCKPHSASYALVSCKSAWLRSHYPAEFIAAVISNQGGFYSPLAYLSEARRMGLQVLAPDINASERAYSGREREVRVGLMQLQGLTRKGLDELLRERQRGGPYRDFQEFLRRTRLDPADIRLLIKAGCFDALEGKQKRPRLLWELLSREAPAAQATGSLFEAARPALPSPPGYDDATVLRQELETLGMLVSCHPLVPYRRQLGALRRIEAAQLGNWVGRYVTLVGWWVTGKVVQTHRGEPMEFISFEDTSASFDTTFFPRAYTRFCRKLSRARPYVLKGKVDEEFGVATLNVEWVGFLDEE
ncbi:DNA-directed DNA polymerase [Desulfuromonas versatilis]|uniref:DNA-directed DNA polymerase n=1 Tax=Desulfuromonas versatilis TaxID=2802975 RepID=A0ABM9SDD9_9BACT|nr:DNA polymerase III subunit alpha [Desulfuromonas versatilis]BCR03046.1 DNA-directed DNA polymerase [Desulfuromonas versatilis]